jgi:hypothetical protein
MGSFNNPHFLYLFDLRSGKKKLAYGRSPQDALDILASRLSPEEMAEVIPDRYLKITQRSLQEHVDELG